MAGIRAFRAYRYDLGRVGALSDVIAPPYDVIDPALQETLYQRSPFNVIRLILNKEESGDNETNNRYVRAARLLRDWQREGILRQDSARALYVYHQEFEVDRRRFLRPGPLGAFRHGQNLSPRRDAGRPQGRPAETIPSHGHEPEPGVRALSG